MLNGEGRMPEVIALSKTVVGLYLVLFRRKCRVLFRDGQPTTVCRLFYIDFYIDRIIPKKIGDAEQSLYMSRTILQSASPFVPATASQ